MLNHLQSVLSSIRDAEQNGLQSTPPSGVLTGYSGEKLTGLLQRLAGIAPNQADAQYLEIGVFQGMTLLSTAFSNPSVPCAGIDNFNFFNGTGKNEALVWDRAKALGVTNIEIVKKGFEAALNELDDHLERKVTTYFIDGPHDYRSQLLCLLYVLPHLQQGAVIVVDDCNYAHVRQATYDFLIAQPQFKLVFEAYTAKHPHYMSEEEEADARRGWWDGVHVLVHDPEDLVEGLVPPIDESTDLFYQDHIVHSSGFAPLAEQALTLAQSLLRPWRLPLDMFRFVRKYLQMSDDLGRYPNLNTYSDTLTKGRVASIRTKETVI